MKYKNLIFVIAVLLGFSAAFYYIHLKAKKIAYVKVGDLYTDFEMKKELESTYIIVQKGRKHQLDSLELELKFLNKKINDEGEKKELVAAFESKREYYLQMKQQFGEDDSQMQEQYTDKIRKQLNQYVSDFGKEKDFDYILGAEGSGAIMYAKDGDDITKDVLIYINNKFKGSK